jgi:hypothetical protein
MTGAMQLLRVLQEFLEMADPLGNFRTPDLAEFA